MFPFFNHYPGSDLHEIDLAYILKLCAELRASNTDLTTWKATHEVEYAELADKVDGLVNSLVDVVVPWDSSIEYHIYSIVEYQGTNYIAIQDVPVGAMITDTNYWQPANTALEQINAIGVTVSDINNKLKYYIDLTATPDVQDIIDNTDYREYILANGTGETISLHITRPMTITGENCEINGQFVIDSHYVTIRNIRFIGSDDATETAITGNYGRWLDISGCFFRLYDKAIFASPAEGQLVDGADSLRHMRGVWRIHDNEFNNVNYAVYADYNTDETTDDVPIGNRWQRNNDWLIANNMINIAIITAMYFRGIDGVTITGNTIFQSRANANCAQGIFFEGRCNYVAITDNKIFECGSEGLRMNDARKLTLIGNHIAWSGYNNVSNAVYLGVSSGGYICAEGNIIERFTGANGIYVAGANGSGVISGNSIILGAPTGYTGTIPTQHAISANTPPYVIANNLVYDDTKFNNFVSARNMRGQANIGTGAASFQDQAKALPDGFYMVNLNGANQNATLQLPEAKHMIAYIHVFAANYIEVIAKPLNTHTYHWECSCSNGTWSSWDKVQQTIV